VTPTLKVLIDEALARSDLTDATQMARVILERIPLEERDEALLAVLTSAIKIHHILEGATTPPRPREDSGVSDAEQNRRPAERSRKVKAIREADAHRVATSWDHSEAEEPNGREDQR
jgi:hypothetical protein